MKSTPSTSVIRTIDEMRAFSEAAARKKKKEDDEDESDEYDSMLVEQIFSGDPVPAADIKHVKKS